MRENSGKSAVLEPDEEVLDLINEGPATLLVSEPSGMHVLDERPPDFVSEQDTFIEGSGDGDTI